MRRLPQLVLVVGSLSLSAVALVLAHHRPEESVANGSGVVLALEALAAAALVAAGVLVWSVRNARAAGALLFASSVAVGCQSLPLPQAGGAVLFTLALVLGGAAATLAGAAAVELTSRARPARLVAVCAVACSTVWLGLLPALLFDPPATGCFGCPRNLVLIRGSPSLRSHVLQSGLRGAAVASVVLALMLLVGVADVARRQWSSAAIRLGAVVALAASAAALWHRASAHVATTDGVVRLAWIVECGGLLLLAAGPVGEFARARIERARIADAVLRTVLSADDLRNTLAASCGDGSLSLVFPQVGGVPVDGNGLPAPAAGGAVITDIVRQGSVLAQLRHRELTAHAARRLSYSVQAAGLALEHTSSRARLRAQLTDLTASRARIVEVADAERRRLERNLHDGAQQRLIALSVVLAEPDDPRLIEARAEVLAALDELRAIAHGIHPASLSDGGIVAFVRELADTSSVPLRLELRPVERLPESVESAAYRVVADCVRAAEQHGNGRAVAIDLELTAEGLEAHLRLPGVAASTVRRTLLHADDRVTAAGGRLEVTDMRNETRVELGLSCGS